MNQRHAESLGQSFTDPSHEPSRFLYVAPLLSEVDRITKACPDLNFRNPQPVEGRKLHHLSTLLDEGANICTTHALFSLLNREIYEKLRRQKYALIIDEVLDCVSMFDGLSNCDRELLFNERLVYLEPGTNRLRWNHREHGVYKGEFDNIRDLCDNGNLVLYRGKALIWEFPIEFLKCFDQVYVLTYMFHGSPMSAYLRAESVDFDMKTLVDGKLVSWAENSDETETKQKLKELITVYNGSANQLGQPKGRENPLSSSWFDKRKSEDLAKLKAATENWFKKHARTPANDNAWTTFKKAGKALKGTRYSKKECWIPNNAKATNDFRHKKSLAYLCNVFYHPMIKGYFEDRGITVNEELYALSEMIQWIWRSQIRDWKPITVFIPSARMRGLFLEWLDSSSVAEMIERKAEHGYARAMSAPLKSWPNKGGFSSERHPETESQSLTQASQEDSQEVQSASQPSVLTVPGAKIRGLSLRDVFSSGEATLPMRPQGLSPATTLPPKRVSFVEAIKQLERQEA
ncbi:hypothetical protein [Microvirga arsenatis]|nr:hypothetical protein [Microvirga arsenatis]NBJ12568.1 hypothetical protein [Microvirga arsenatis]